MRRVRVDMKGDEAEATVVVALVSRVVVVVILVGFLVFLLVLAVVRVAISCRMRFGVDLVPSVRLSSRDMRLRVMHMALMRILEAEFRVVTRDVGVPLFDWDGDFLLGWGVLIIEILFGTVFSLTDDVLLSVGLLVIFSFATAATLLCCFEGVLVSRIFFRNGEIRCEELPESEDCERNDFRRALLRPLRSGV